MVQGEASMRHCTKSKCKQREQTLFRLCLAQPFHPVQYLLSLWKAWLTELLQLFLNTHIYLYTIFNQLTKHTAYSP